MGITHVKSEKKKIQIKKIFLECSLRNKEWYSIPAAYITNGGNLISKGQRSRSKYTVT